MNKILFLLKRREDYSETLHYSHNGLSTGLFNSASFMNEMLNESGIESNLSVVVDNDCIDREVTKYRPTHVIIEALWVVPSKFEILQKLHPNVKWIVRLHSEMPFLANEGIAMSWIAGYAKHKNVFIGVNAPRMMEEVNYFLKSNSKTIYLPNFYPQDYKNKKLDKTKEYIDIGCFGAIRPMKNHLVQAIAAVQFADHIGKKLRFHINSGRTEMKGEPVLHNLIGMFEELKQYGHELVHHTWAPREEFLKTCANMDIGLQVSFSETFNIVCADLISQGVPIVGSSEIPWSSCIFDAVPTESYDIRNALINTYCFSEINLFIHKRQLSKYTNKTRRIWLNYFK